jgi:hypothetical protein
MKTYDYTRKGQEQKERRGATYGPASERTGERNPNARFTNGEIRMMREYRAGGWTHEELAFLFQCHPARCSEICRGLAYKDAGGPIEEFRTYRTHRGRPAGS